MLQEPIVSVLGKDPERKHRINANSFQQNAITTVNGWQYVAFYTDAGYGKIGRCYANLARRQTFQQEGTWQSITFEDEQTVDDGHNTISIGVCAGDGTIHMAFNHHCDQLKFKISKLGATLDSSTCAWTTTLFSATQNFLPGVPLNDLMEEVTYPRFVNTERDLIVTYRIGQAGLGSDILYRYSAETHRYTYVGQHLTGVSNSPYINGIDYRLSRLHISWCYRNFVEVDSASSQDAHRHQAGPNGPENNHDLCYAYSDDLGESWNSSNGVTVANLKEGFTIRPNSKDIRVFEIPMGSGILNQEAQSADWEGGFWVLNRESVSGEEHWIVYYLKPDGHWTKTLVPCISIPTETGSRGSMCVDRQNRVYLVIPGNLDSSLSVMRGRWRADAVWFETLWRSYGFDGEPLVDVQRLEVSDTLSVFTRTDKRGADGKRYVVVLDFVLPLEGDPSS